MRDIKKSIYYLYNTGNNIALLRIEGSFQHCNMHALFYSIIILSFIHTVRKTPKVKSTASLAAALQSVKNTEHTDISHAA